MDLHEEIARKAFELYKKKGCPEGRDVENWLDAERIVLSRHAGQDMEEPEGEETLFEEETIAEEVEGTELKQASQQEEEETAGTEEIEAREPFVSKKTSRRITEAAEKTMPAKRVASKKKAAPQKRETSKKKT